MNKKALYNITYGLYLLSAQADGRDNACIINTAVQVANDPTRVAISVIQKNLTHDMILHTGVFNLSVLSQDATFKTFEQFGFRSGRSTPDKFDASGEAVRSANGLRYLTV